MLDVLIQNLSLTQKHVHITFKHLLDSNIFNMILTHILKDL